MLRVKVGPFGIKDLFTLVNLLSGVAAVGFTVEGEVDLLRRHRIDVVVSKNSGGPATVAKLTAARRLGVPVVMVERPPLPAGVARAGTVDEAVSWLTAHSG